MKLLKKYQIVKSIVFVWAVLVMPVSAFEGAGAMPDCGSDQFEPGDLPDPESCSYPGVGTMMVYPGLPVFLQVCNASLIHTDEYKAVMVTAAHCVEEIIYLGLPNHVTFEPQPSIPYSDGPRGLPIRPIDLIENIIPVSATLVHPLHRNVGNYGQNYYGNDLAVLLIDMTVTGVPEALEDLELFSIPPVANYLNGFKPSELKDANMTFAGYGSRTSDAIVNNDASFKPSNKKNLVPAQHNRQYGPASYVGLQTSFLTFSMKISKDETIGCSGNSGSPVILEDEDEEMVLGVYSGGLGNVCNQTSAEWFVRLDTFENYVFLQCAVDPGLNIEDVSTCIQESF